MNVDNADLRKQEAVDRFHLQVFLAVFHLRFFRSALSAFIRGCSFVQSRWLLLFALHIAA